MRGWDRVMRLAWTLADLDAVDRPTGDARPAAPWPCGARCDAGGHGAPRHRGAPAGTQRRRGRPGAGRGTGRVVGHRRTGGLRRRTSSSPASGPSARSVRCCSPRTATSMRCWDAASTPRCPGAEDPAVLLGVLRTAVERWRPRLASVEVGDVLAAAGAVGAGLLVPESDGWPPALDDLGPHAPVVLWTRSTGAASATGRRRSGSWGPGRTRWPVPRPPRRSPRRRRTPDSSSSAGAPTASTPWRTASPSPPGRPRSRSWPVASTSSTRWATRSCSTTWHGRAPLLAESAPGTRPTRWRFLARNRLIAALADVTVVVEAGARSGALNTAHHAAQLGRPVFAVPGAFASSASVGCHRLIAQGRAQIVVHPGDPVAATRAATGTAVERCRTSRSLSGRQDPEVLRVARRARPSCCCPRPRSPAGPGMSTADVADALALAQLQGLVVASGGGWGRA